MQRTSKELLNFLCMVLARLGGLLHYTTLHYNAMGRTLHFFQLSTTLLYDSVKLVKWYFMNTF